MSTEIPPPIDLNNLKLSHPLLRKLESLPLTPSSLPKFRQIHAQLLVTSLLHHPLAAGRAIRHLCLASLLRHALRLFPSLSSPDAFVSNILLKALLPTPSTALAFYRRHAVSVPPNHFTFPILSTVLTDACAVQDGKVAHGRAVKLGLDSGIHTLSSFVRMYSSFGDVGTARLLYEEGRCFVSDPFFFNAMIDGYVKNKMVSAAREVFDEMPVKDNVSWNVIILGYAGIGEMETAEKLFLEMPGADVVSWNALLDGYAKLGEIVPARVVFDKMPERNVVSWNMMLALYVREKLYEDCMKLFDLMVAGGKADVCPNEATLVSVLTACGHLGQLDLGRWIHYHVNNARWNVLPDVLLSTSLLTMYAKCGELESATKVFDGMPKRSVVSWNSMIMGYGLHGKAGKAIELFLEMEKTQSSPNEATLVCMLCACTHAGLVIEAWWCFDRMVRVHNVKPNIEHYGCMVDLLARKGMLESSKVLMDNATPVALQGAMLAAFVSQSNWMVGEIVAKRMMEVQPNDVGCYVLLSNIYAAQGRWDDVENVRRVMRERGLNKCTGTSISLVVEEGSALNKKSIMHYMLSELGALMKL